MGAWQLRHACGAAAPSLATLRGVPPVDPPPTIWHLPDPAVAPDRQIVGVGADLEPGTLLAAYRAGMFPFPLTALVRPDATRPPMGWWSPDPRTILPLDRPTINRSLRPACRRFEIRVDTAFDAVIAACGDPRRPGGWIDDEIVAAYRRLHELGWVHSVEAWSVEEGVLAGGLYGVAIGGLFAGESMFHYHRDASKVALVGLSQLLRERGYVLHDVQWLTPHLARLGAVEIPRAEYLRLLRDAVSVPAEPLGPLPEPLRLLD